MAIADDVLESNRSESADLKNVHGGESAGDHDDAVSRRIGEWAKRLLQLGRGNNLLYFRPGRSAVGITRIAPDELDVRLRRLRRGLTFPYAPPARRRRRGFAVHDEDAHDEDAVVRPGDLNTDCEPADLQRRLRNLQRRDREWELILPSWFDWSPVSRQIDGLCLVALDYSEVDKAVARWRFTSWSVISHSELICATVRNSVRDM